MALMKQRKRTLILSWKLLGLGGAIIYCMGCNMIESYDDAGQPEEGSWRNLFFVGLNRMDLTNDRLNRYPFNNLADVTELLGKNDTGFYWQIPRSGGTTLRHIFGSCLDRVQASRVSRDYCDSESDTLEICETRLGRFVNADPSDDPGIQRARELGLARSGLADVVVSSRFLHATSLFDNDGVGGGGRGRAFTILRHPVERSVSTFYYLREATWERNYNPAFKTMSLLDYANHPETASNWMVRWLTGKNHEPELGQQDLEFAKQLLRRKFLILLTQDMGASVDRLVQYMGWTDDVPKVGLKCARAAGLKVAAQNRNNHTKIEKTTKEYEELEKINNLDIVLYEYAVRLFHEQQHTIFHDKTPLSPLLTVSTKSDPSRKMPLAEKGKSVIGTDSVNSQKQDAEVIQSSDTIGRGFRPGADTGDIEISWSGLSGTTFAPMVSKSSLPIPPAMFDLANKFDKRY